jgi:DNA-directed RNA polymerase specialized sigma24 family protein
MLMRVYIDFNAIPPEHAEIDRRLRNWARWLRPAESPAIAPGFDLYRSPARARGAEHTWATEATDGGDAARVNSVVQTLPQDRRAALSWAYCRPVNPKAAAREIGVSLEVLAWLLRDARQRLLDQGA